MRSDEKLAGKTVVVTRPLAQAKKMCASLELYLASIVHFPVLSITPSNKPNLVKQKLQQLNNYDHIFFISVNAVQYAMNLVQEVHMDFNNKSLAAVGPTTKKALEEYGYQVSVVPSKGFNSEALLEHETLKNISGERILIIRGQGGREHLRQELESRGAMVEYAEVYQRELPKQRNPIDLSQLPNIDSAVLIYSVESAQNLWSLCSINEQQWLKNATLIVAGSRIASAVGTLGFAKNPIIAENPSDEAMLGALITWADTS